MKKNILGLITARGGSKGIPHKNICTLAGKPLIAWTIECAQKAPSLTHIVTSTDNDDIGAVSKKYGAEVPFMRPAELAGDSVSSLDVVRHAIEYFQSEEQCTFDAVMILQPTSPFRTPEDIESSIAIMNEKNAEIVISVSQTSDHPYVQKEIRSDGRMYPFITRPDEYMPRQKFPTAYIANGAIFLIQTNILNTIRDIHTHPQTYPYIMPPERALDIDSPWDLHLAELIMQDQ